MEDKEKLEIAKINLADFMRKKSERMRNIAKEQFEIKSLLLEKGIKLTTNIELQVQSLEIQLKEEMKCIKNLQELEEFCKKYLSKNGIYTLIQKLISLDYKIHKIVKELEDYKLPYSDS